MPVGAKRLGLLSAYRQALPRETYLRPEAEGVMGSYAGYPVVPAGMLGLSGFFSGAGMDVAGMAWGGSDNPRGQGGPSVLGGSDYEQPSIVVNPNTFQSNPAGNVKANALIRLEALRHFMSEGGYKPSFKITPELESWRKSVFGNSKKGDPGYSYLTDDDVFRQTVLSRAMVGDTGGADTPMPIPSDALKEVASLQKRLEEKNKKSKPSIGDSLKQLIFRK